MSEGNEKKRIGPKSVTLKNGETYYWCACGLSKTQPFCDKAHEHGGTEIAPFGFGVNEDKVVSLCNCKKTAAPPFCDKSHDKERKPE